MILVTTVILILLIVGVVIMTPYNPGKNTRALQDELEHTIALARRELGTRYEEQGTPICIEHLDRIEHDTLGTLHILDLTCERTRLLHPDFHILLGPSPYAPGPLQVTGKLFNGERTFVLVYQSKWRFDFMLETLFDTLFASPGLKDFAQAHQNLALRSCLITHDRVSLRVIVPEVLLKHQFGEELDIRQKRVLQHCDTLLAHLASMTLHPDLSEPLLLIGHLFERADALGLSWSDRTEMLEVLIASDKEDVLARMWCTLIERAESKSTTPGEFAQLVEWLFQSADVQIMARTWRVLFEREDPLDILKHYGALALEQFSEEDLVTLIRRDHITHAMELVELFELLLPRLPLSLLADETINFDFKLRLMSTWLQMSHLQPGEIQQALRDMIMAHPFERQRIQRHISTIPGLQLGAISLSHGLPNGNISIVTPGEESA